MSLSNAIRLHFNVAVMVPCEWLFASCNNIIFHVGKFDMQSGKKTWMPPLSVRASKAHKKLV